MFIDPSRHSSSTCRFALRNLHKSPSCGVGRCRACRPWTSASPPPVCGDWCKFRAAGRGSEALRSCERTAGGVRRGRRHLAKSGTFPPPPAVLVSKPRRNRRSGAYTIPAPRPSRHATNGSYTSRPLRGPNSWKSARFRQDDPRFPRVCVAELPEVLSERRRGVPPARMPAGYTRPRPLHVSRIAAPAVRVAHPLRLLHVSHAAATAQLATLEASNRGKNFNLCDTLQNMTLQHIISDLRF